MSSKASIGKHPVHPMLVAIPLGLWVFSLVCDVLHALSVGGVLLKHVAYVTLGGGIVGALVAAVPGLIDLLSMSPGRVKRIGIWHMAVNLVAVAVFTVDFLIRRGDPAATLPVVLSVAGNLLIGVSGWLGGEMVYVHGVGVEDRAKPRG